MRRTAIIVLIMLLVSGWAAFAQEQSAAAPGQQDIREITPSVYGLVGLERVGFFVRDIDADATERTGLTKTMISDYFSRILAETDTVAFANRGQGVPWFHVDVRLKPLEDVDKTAYCVDIKLVQNAFIITETKTVLVPYAAIWQCPGYLQVVEDDACADAVKMAIKQAVDYFADLYVKENTAENEEGKTADPGDNGDGGEKTPTQQGEAQK